MKVWELSMPVVAYYRLEAKDQEEALRLARDKIHEQLASMTEVHVTFSGPHKLELLEDLGSDGEPV